MATKAQQKELDRAVEEVQEEDISSLNAYQRVQRIAGMVGKIDATGKNQFKSDAISIEDTENAIRDLLTRFGLVTVWSYNAGPPTPVPDEKLWMAALQVRVVNVDNPDDCLVANWFDTGGNPMAATSFARKGFYKALFHLAASDDETSDSPGRQYSARPKPSRQESQSHNPYAASVAADFNSPASDNQRNAINKLLRQYGRTARLMGGDLTVGEAGEIIKGLQNDQAFESEKFTVNHREDPQPESKEQVHPHKEKGLTPGKGSEPGVCESEPQQEQAPERRYTQEQIDAAMEANPAAAEQARKLTEAAQQGSGAIPKSSPFKPSSANQLATINKLLRLLGESGDADENMTSADASEIITRLSRDYNEAKQNQKRST